MDKRWGMGQPPWLWRRRCMGQSLIGDFTGHICLPQEINQSLRFNDPLQRARSQF